MKLLNVDMRRVILLVISLIYSLLLFSAIHNYNTAQTKLHTLKRQYTQVAEYYQKKAEGFRREALNFKKKAEGYQHMAANHTRNGDADCTKDYNRRAARAMDDYKTQMRYATNADEKAADYLKRAARLLQK